jgi:hypothetical protein
MGRRVERLDDQEKIMNKKMSFAMCTLLLAVAGASQAAIHVQCNQAHGKCVPPTPPAPPVPPIPPAPPAPPELPEVPAGAHAACASKAEGVSVVYTIRKGETMTGVCERKNGKMVFQLRRYDLDD